MSEASGGHKTLWRGPVLAWAALLVLAAISLASAYLPLGAGNVALNLIIAAAMAVVLAIFLMDLKSGTMLVRVVAITGLFWMMFMFALTFSDYLSRI
ncbi:oxidase [Bradyrhizobium sp. ISRA443]|uniref:oxidase n=1 Tax=unclassified Bradyrhizobium TaxID=2631580 RepID=UPI00247B0D8A|nr:MULTISPECIES: oxidase [unclassified Bradyrhizobium]WGR98551.1 oxidase [Bradyrhizobium sp. ISRA436]WGS05440.1 oxidase [Bradyrhizobium sp. ISRA437]WGS12326.1 oxidase [Bradyrhizobium sp. ISRA443]